jgi:preprotein translocase subunit YajC
VAQANNAPAAQSPGGGLTGMLVPMLLIFGVMYLLVIRPQSKRAKETQKMLSELRKGDEVATTGGMIGRISGIKDNEIILQVQEGVRIRVQRSAVTGRLKPSPDSPKTEAKTS